MSENTVRIGINAYEANVTKRVGSNMYAYKLLCELERQTRLDTTVMFEIFLPSAPVADMPQERKGWRYQVCTPSFLWTQWRLPLALFLSPRRLHVFLSLGHYAPRFCPVPSVVCILDLAFLKFPQFFLKKDLYQLTAWTKYSVRQAAHVFTISENSKMDIEREYGTPSDRITIVHPGIEENADLEGLARAQQDAILSSYGIQRGAYIVSVGTIQPRKNMINVIAAFEQLLQRNDGNSLTHLVFVGKAGWMTQEFDQAIARSPAKDKIIVTGFVADSVRRVLLANSACSVLVGYYEGFGIPALDSLWEGVTPVVANTGSLPEVVGEYGVLVDPYDPTNIANGFVEAAKRIPDTMRRSQMRLWARQFSWEESGKKILEVLRAFV